MLGAIKASLPLISGKLGVCLSAEKEYGTNGFKAIENLLPRYDAAIFGAPTNLGVIREIRGSMQVVIHSRGDVHTRPKEAQAKTAIDAFTEDWAKIRAIDLRDSSRWGGASLTPTTIQGSGSASQHANLVTSTLDIRTTPTKSNDWILNQLKACGLEFYPHGESRNPVSSEPKHPLLLAVREAIPDFIDSSLDVVSDASYAKAPSIIMGPGKSERAQLPDEFCTYSEIRDGITTYRASLAKFLGRPLLYVRSAEEVQSYGGMQTFPEVSASNA
jgi:acetylornithine deacetylase